MDREEFKQRFLQAQMNPIYFYIYPRKPKQKYYPFLIRELSKRFELYYYINNNLRSEDAYDNDSIHPMFKGTVKFQIFDSDGNNILKSIDYDDQTTSNNIKCKGMYYRDKKGISTSLGYNYDYIYFDSVNNKDGKWVYLGIEQPYFGYNQGSYPGDSLIILPNGKYYYKEIAIDGNLLNEESIEFTVGQDDSMIDMYLYYKSRLDYYYENQIAVGNHSGEKNIYTDLYNLFQVTNNTGSMFPSDDIRIRIGRECVTIILTKDEYNLVIGYIQEVLGLSDSECVSAEKSSKEWSFDTFALNIPHDCITNKLYYTTKIYSHIRPKSEEIEEPKSSGGSTGNYISISVDYTYNSVSVYGSYDLLQKVTVNDEVISNGLSSRLVDFEYKDKITMSKSIINQSRVEHHSLPNDDLNFYEFDTYGMTNIEYFTVYDLTKCVSPYIEMSYKDGRTQNYSLSLSNYKYYYEPERNQLWKSYSTTNISYNPPTEECPAHYGEIAYGSAEMKILYNTYTESDYQSIQYDFEDDYFKNGLEYLWMRNVRRKHGYVKHFISSQSLGYYITEYTPTHQEGYGWMWYLVGKVSGSMGTEEITGNTQEQNDDTDTLYYSRSIDSYNDAKVVDDKTGYERWRENPNRERINPTIHINFVNTVLQEEYKKTINNKYDSYYLKFDNMLFSDYGKYYESFNGKVVKEYTGYYPHEYIGEKWEIPDDSSLVSKYLLQSVSSQQIRYDYNTGKYDSKNENTPEIIDTIIEL